MKIFFASIGKPTTFIIRRIESLLQKEIQVMVDWDQFPPNLNEYPITEQSFKKTSWKRILFVFFFPRLWKESMVLYRKEFHYSWRHSFNKANFLCEIAHVKPDIIHVQWTNSARDFFPLKNRCHIPIIAAVRGTQITTSPFISEKSAEIIQQTLEKITYFQTVSQDLQSKLEEMGVKPYRIILNYNGVNLQLFKNLGSRTFQKDSLKIILVARKYWSKCVESVFFILFELKKKKIPFQITWVGLPENDLYLQHLINRFEFSKEEVILLGKGSTQDLVQWYNDSDIILSTSAAEGLANVVLEAMVTGVIPVVWDCEGMKEAIEPNKSGFVIPFGEVSGMVEVLEKLYHEPEKRKEISLNAQSTTEKFFDEKVHTEKMIQEYRLLLDNNQRN
jgi:glycosyltransferase involved in cell wall biosynthesis